MIIIVRQAVECRHSHLLLIHLEDHGCQGCTEVTNAIRKGKDRVRRLYLGSVELTPSRQLIQERMMFKDITEGTSHGTGTRGAMNMVEMSVRERKTNNGHGVLITLLPLQLFQRVHRYRVLRVSAAVKFTVGVNKLHFLFPSVEVLVRVDLEDAGRIFHTEEGEEEQLFLKKR